MRLSTTAEEGRSSVARYEQLREHVLGHAHSRGGAPGLTLVMRRGVAACITMIEATPNTTSSEHEIEGLELDEGLRGEIARVMVAMALGATSYREEHA